MADGLNTLAKLDAPGGGEAVEVMMRAAMTELLRACGKFPTFPKLFCLPCLDTVQRHLERARAVNDGKSELYESTAHLVFAEELAEMMEAVLSGDLESARTELIQAMAMLMRIYVHLPEYCEAARGEVVHG